MAPFFYALKRNEDQLEDPEDGLDIAWLNPRAKQYFPGYPGIPYRVKLFLKYITEMFGILKKRVIFTLYL